ncbi:MAG: hypothetical protein R3C04_08730 [Hyphomonas sp.]
MFSQFISISRFLALLVVVCLGLLAAPTDARAQSAIERLVSPGKLSGAHVEQEKECSSCHASFDKKAQTQLCRDCHEDVDKDILSNSGFHGRSPDVSGAECKSCHTEHEGRGADIVGLNQAGFDHEFTDYSLTGKHRDVECAACHRPNVRHAEAPHDCISCHREDDPHVGRLGEDCASCHSPKDWGDVTFDHGSTSFALLGAHADVKCAACHENQTWKGVGSDCIDCHRSDDAHDGRFGIACASCHEVTSWTKIKFNHDTTGFRLTGRHSSIACEACHGKGKPDPAPKTCIGCHKADDVHKGRNGADCASCHSSGNWKQVDFDHASTGFALHGQHATAKCESCHTKPISEWTPPGECIDCHRDDDQHEGLLGPACADCHEESGWALVRFDHDRDTGFALLGAHDSVECGGCHKVPANQAVPAAACASCHREEDPHEGQLGDGCGSCHGVESWTEKVRFDHEFTDFPLLGEHASAACEDCHVTKAFLDASSACHDCHADDDVHKGGLGPDCASCHNPKGWAFWSFNHDTQTSFALQGAHASVACEGCHTSNAKGRFKTSSRCVSCHSADDKHRGAFGSSCERCHNTEAFWAVDVARSR